MREVRYHLVGVADPRTTYSVFQFVEAADAPVLTGIGYAEAVAHLRGEVSLEALPEVMARSNRRYARRQLRWLRRSPGITWFDATTDPVPGILGYLREQLC